MFQKPSADLSFSHDDEHDEEETYDEHMDTVVGPSVHVEGDFASEGNILVKGMVTGDVKTSRSLTVEEGAKITANVQAEHGLISGEVTGNMTIEDRLELTETARILGDVSCATLVVHAGALITGKITMAGLEKTKTKKTTKKRGRSKKVGTPATNKNIDIDEEE